MTQNISIAIRIFKKYFFTKSISIATLTIGFLFLLIALTLSIKEYNFNNKFSKSRNIFRIDTRITSNDGEYQDLSLSLSLIGPYLQSNLASVNSFTRVLQDKRLSLQAGETTYYNQDIVYVDSSFFRVFDFEKVHGTLKEFLPGKRDVIVITEGLSKKLFDSEPSIGKLLRIKGKLFTISAIIKESKTDLDHDVYAPMDDDPYNFSWLETFIYNSGLTKEDLGIEVNKSLESRMAGEYNQDAMEVSFELTELSNLRFDGKLFGKRKSNKSFIQILVGLSILIIF